jgi:AcrR family transcriptional regulator
MSRPSLAETRRREILDAAEACVLEHGIEGVTFARVAERAGVRTSIVPHYFGSKGALLAALVDRTLDRVQAVLDAAVDGATGRTRLERLLDVLFGGELAVPRVILVIDQLRASSYFNEATRTRLVGMFRHFDALAEEVLQEAHPDAPAELRRSIAYAVLCLGDANNSFRAHGFPARYDHHAREAAWVLLAALERATPTAT